MDHLPGLAWIKDLAGRYVYANKGCQVLPTYSSYAHYAGKTDADLWPADIAAEYRRNDRKVIETRSGIQDIETLLVDGHRRSVLVNKFPIFDVHGNLAFVGGIAFDITRHLQTESELKQSHAQLRALAAKLESARDQEARRIAREIHDELGQTLTSLNMDCACLEKRIQRMRSRPARSELLLRLDSMSECIEQTVKTVQRICAELRPGVLDDLGLVAALECQAAEFQARTNVRCKWLARPAALQLPSTQALAVFRIFQEILTNVARHAAASEVTIKLVAADGSLKLEVRDNGKGIAPEDVFNAKSLGLLGMRERAFLGGGLLEVTPGKGRGTVVSLDLPLDTR